MEQSFFVRLVFGEQQRGQTAGGIGLGAQVKTRQSQMFAEQCDHRRPAKCRGFGVQPSCRQPQDQVLRNQRVGSRWSVADSGPRLAAAIRIRMSLGDALAYSTKTSK